MKCKKCGLDFTDWEHCEYSAKECPNRVHDREVKKIKRKKKFSWDKTKKVLHKIIDNPITRTAIQFTPRPVRIGFSWVNRKLIQNDMIKDKKWYQSKTVWSAILLVLTAILQALGVDVVSNPEVMQSVYEVLYVVAGAFGLFGLRAAIGDKIDKDK